LYQVGQACGAYRSTFGYFLYGGLVEIEDNALVSSVSEALNHVGAHSAQADHS
jgi:hypothetical protein